jgi:hypothetical protein
MRPPQCHKVCQCNDGWLCEDHPAEPGQDESCVAIGRAEVRDRVGFFLSMVCAVLSIGFDW